MIFTGNSSRGSHGCEQNVERGSHNYGANSSRSTHECEVNISTQFTGSIDPTDCGNGILDRITSDGLGRITSDGECRIIA